MVLVDASVWIRSLANRAPFRVELDRLLGLDDVAGHELVCGELLIGDRGGRRKLLAAYEQIHRATLVPHSDVVRFVTERARRWLDRHSSSGVHHCGTNAVVDRRRTFVGGG
jgi:predicted nucleic acid-binding protein